MSSETLALSILEFPFKTTWNFSTIQTQFESGHVQTRARWTQPRRHFQVQNVVASESEMENIVGFYRDMKGPADSFSIALPNKVVSPYAAPTLGEVTGSTEGARTRYVRYCWSKQPGTLNTLVSSQYSVKAVTSLYKLTVTVPEFPAGVDYAYIYVGATVGVLKRQAVPVSISGGTWTEPAEGYDAGGESPQATNTLTETATVHFLEDSLVVTQLTAIQWAISFVLEELF